MTVEEMKAAIIVTLQNSPDATFVDLARSIPEFEGEQALGTIHENLFLWNGVSKIAVSALAQLDRENRIRYRQTSEFTYIIDGLRLTLPKAKLARAYKAPHWLPVTLHLTA